MLFSCKNNAHNHPQICFNGTVVAKVEEQKHLGLTLKAKLSFGKHPSGKIIKAKTNIGIIKHLSRFLPLKTLDQMYKALVRPHLDYFDVIYHIPPKQDKFSVVLNSLMETVEKVQYQAALAVTGAWKGSSRSKLYEELGWESLSDRRCRRILQIHKILNNKTPSYLQTKLPRHRRPLYRLNIADDFHEIRCKSSRYMNSFFPDGIKAWNNVIGHFPNIPSINILKGHILSLICPVKRSIFNIHDPIGLRYLFYLRVGLSPLRSHKNRHGFVDTLSDKCLCNHGIEDTNHFLFFCSFFTIERATRASVVKILQKYNLNTLINNLRLYLYGHRTINFADNSFVDNCIYQRHSALPGVDVCFIDIPLFLSRT